MSNNQRIMNARRSDARNSALHPEKRKKRRRRSSFILLYITLALAAAVTLVVLSLTVFFHIDTINVKGKSRYTAAEIIAASGIKKDVNLFMADVSKASGNVAAALPYIDHIKVEKKLPSTVVITVEETKAAGQIEAGDSYYRINRQGKCLEVQKTLQKGVPVIRGTSLDVKTPGQRITFAGENADALVTALDALYSGFEMQKISPISVINLSDPLDITATFENRVVLQFGSSGNLSEKMAYAKLVLDQQASSTQTGVLNLSRIPNEKQQAYFTATNLKPDQIAAVLQ